MEQGSGNASRPSGLRIGGQWFTRMTGALVRAFLVWCCCATPSLLLPRVRRTRPRSSPCSRCSPAALTFVEYASTYPGLVEFRYAPPFNRIRFVVAVPDRLPADGDLPRPGRPDADRRCSSRPWARLIGQAIDFPYSPVRLITLMLPSDTHRRPMSMLVRTAAGHGLSDLAVTLAIFVIMLKIFGWPARQRRLQRLGQPADLRPDGRRRRGRPAGTRRAH